MKQNIKEKDIRDMQKCFDKISSISKRIREYNPTAHIVVKDADTLTFVGNDDYSNLQEYVAEKWISGMNTEQ